MGGRLSDYYVSYQGNWSQYFTDLDNVKNSSSEVNQTLTQFLVPEHRISGDIKPTPEDQKKALEQKQASEQPKRLIKAISKKNL